MTTFRAGTRVTVGEQDYEVVTGDKGPGDLVLRRIPSNPHFVTMAELAFEFEFLYQNEDRLYPERWHQGGEKLVEFVRYAAAHGWEVAVEEYIYKARRERADAAQRAERASLRQVGLFGEVPDLQRGAGEAMCDQEQGPD